MKIKPFLIITAIVIGLTACNNEEIQIEETVNSIEVTKIEKQTILLNGISHEANFIINAETGEKLELIDGLDADKIEAFFEEHSNYSTHINLENDLVQYFSNDEKMDAFMKTSTIVTSTNMNKSAGDGIIQLYEHSTFGGRMYSRDIPLSVQIVESDLNNIIVGGSHFNDIISCFSIFSASSTTKISIRFYEHANLNGRSIAFSGRHADIWDLRSQCRKKTLWICTSSWNDAITSYSVIMTPVSSGGGSGGGGGTTVEN